MQTAIFPMKIMRFSSITTRAHAKCRNGKPSDRPIDLVGADGGKDWVYAPCDIVCLKVYRKASHGLWFRSIDKVKTPSGEKYVYFLAEHMSVSGHKVGRTFKRGAKLFTEGRYGNASGNHIHWSTAISDKKVALGSGWRKNSKGAWVLYIPGTTNVEINKALYLDPNFTKTIKDTRIKFSKVSESKVVEPSPEPKMPTYKVGESYTLQENMFIRIGHSTSSPRVSRSKMTDDARAHCNSDGELKKGTRVTVKEVYKEGQMCWVKTPSGWICGYSSNKIYIK